jgi:hypothetical protein
MLRDADIEARKALARGLLECCNTGGETFLLHIVIGHGTLVSHFKLESKQQSME